MNNDKYISDDELRVWCIQNYATPEIGECTNCPFANECDDFNGNNGEDYLWEIAKDDGFKTNIDYCINKVMKQYEIDNDIVKAIEDFFDIWFKSDGFYDEYDYYVYEYKDKLFVSFAFANSY